MEMFAGPALVTARSATGVTLVNTGGVVLLVGLGSLVGEPALAALVKLPLAGACTVRVTLLAMPLARSPKFQVTIPPLVTPPPLALTKLAPAGTASVTVTLLAVDG